MEIPYIVTPRKDTGLYNAKIALWLFLASEVMLFGGFFSAYIFLRIGADYPWPERTLPVLPGLINTFILIASSVTVVFAWASLKLRQWGKFQIFMGITIACAAVFMVLKGIEYNVKFHHQAVRLTDYTVIEGHLGYERKEGAPAEAGHGHGEEEYELDHRGHKIEENQILVQTSALSFDTVRFYKPWVSELLAQAEHRGSRITLAEDVKAVTQEKGSEEVIAKAGEELSVSLLNRIKKIHLAARKHNNALRTAANLQEWKEAKAKHPGQRDWEFASEVNIDVEALQPRLLTEIGGVRFQVDPPVRFDFKPRDIREGAESSSLRDGTGITGTLLPSPMVFHYVDAIDFQHLAMKAHERGIEPEAAIENSWLLKNNAFAREAWQWHREELAKLEQYLLKKYGFHEDGSPKRVPTHKERYRIEWKDLAAKATGTPRGEAKIQFKEEFFGPDYHSRGNETFPELSVPREEIRFASKFTPSWNTYYAIYFTITGLHGLHVIGGAIVLSYYLFFGRKMYLENPEWLANRVEVGGLFWHFVDLVWIFAFPILYLM